MSSGRLADYLGKGAIADRPSSLDLHPEAIGFWYATDTEAWTAWDGTGWITVVAEGATAADDVSYDNATSGLTATDVQAAIDELAAGSGSAPTAYTIITEASAFTATPGTHDGLFRYIRAGGNVTFNSSQAYTAGMVFNIRATGAVTLVGAGVTLTPPAGGTLGMTAGMSVQVVMTSSTAGDVIGQTVAA